MAESILLARKIKASTAERRWMENPAVPSSCVTPAGTSIEVQNEWEENTHTHTKFDFTVDEGKEWLNPSREKY